MTGPLWEASITSLEPDVRVWRQVSLAEEPAATVMTFEVAVVGLGPPLQTMSLEVTSVMGWGLLVSVFEMKGEQTGRGRGEREKWEMGWE
jgi:hypothetical protein